VLSGFFFWEAEWVGACEREKGGLCAEGWYALWSAEGKKKGQREKAGIGEKGVLVPWSGVCGSVLMAGKKNTGELWSAERRRKSFLGRRLFFSKEGVQPVD